MVNQHVLLVQQDRFRVKVQPGAYSAAQVVIQALANLFALSVPQGRRLQ